jgi:pimeloyl-ACP methyl ester carboxylesterase
MRKQAKPTEFLVTSDAAQQGRPGSTLVVQVLGSQDDMVSPEDNVDLVSGGDFLYLDAAYSGHASIIKLDDPTHGPGRKEVVELALKGGVAELREAAVIPSDNEFLGPDFNVKHVLFVMHGIRDPGYWTHKIARQVKRVALTERKLDEWATETSSYGYFPMLPFLFTRYRRKYVEWMMDQYTQTIARYPNAKVSYIGHSNGTYLLAKALELYPSCRFDKVVFAGSVVHRSYNWSRYMGSDCSRRRRARVGAVLNFAATADWVVAFFPKMFQLMRLQDIGSAGHDGFALENQPGNVRQVTYIKGGHGAAIDESVWKTIANFVVKEEIDEEYVPGRLKHRNFLVWLLGLFPFVVWIGLGLLLVSLGWGVILVVGASVHPD